MSIFNRTTYVTKNDVPYMPIAVIKTVSSSSETIVDKEGKTHQISVQHEEYVPLDNGIDPTLDADALNLDNCIRNNFNLEPCNGFSIASEAPENCVNDIDVIGLSKSLVSDTEIKQKTSTESKQNPSIQPISEPSKTE